MDEWSSLAKTAVGLAVVLAFLGLVVFLIFFTRQAGNKEFARLEISSDYESYAAYHDKEVDKAMAKNIARANYSRISLRIPSTSTVMNSASLQLDMENPQTSLSAIDNYFNTIQKVGGKNPSFVIKCVRDLDIGTGNNGDIVRIEITRIK